MADWWVSLTPAPGLRYLRPRLQNARRRPVSLAGFFGQTCNGAGSIQVGRLSI